MEKLSNDNRAVTRVEMAEILGLSEKTIRSYVKQGMPVMQLRKNAAVRFNVEEVMRWLREQGTEGK